MAQADESRESGPVPHGSVDLPAPTAWPLVLAFGLTLVVAGLVTAAAVSILGAILTLIGCVGWFFEVLPHEHHETQPVKLERVEIVTTRREVARLELAPELKRLRLPVEIYPVAAGIRGGLAGSVAMAAVAMIYGLIIYHSAWYPINLLGAVVYARALELTTARLAAFSMVLFLVAAAIHLATSLLVGLLYGAMLPMLPRRPILLGGVIAPLLWSGLVYAVLGIVNPLLDQRIDWWWFVASQVAFGLVAGLVVIRHQRVRVAQFIPFAVRAGLEAPGVTGEDGEDQSL